MRKGTLLWALLLGAVLAAPALCQDDGPVSDGAPAAEKPAADQGAGGQSAAEEPVSDAPAQPAPAAVPAKAAAPKAAARRPAKKAGAKTAAKAQSPDDNQGVSVDKSRFEAYLKERLARIDEQQRIRASFFEKEKKDWESFWSVIRKERREFEFRLTRQTLDLFDSLASLDANGQNMTITNFEKLQTDFIRSFEANQKTKINEFFAERDARWKEFASEQERERIEFTTDAETGWEQQKSSLGVGTPSKKSKKKAASSDGPAPGTVIRANSDEPPPGTVIKAKPSPLRKTEPAPAAATPTDKEDVWH